MNDENSRCPRCGGRFHCGANDPAPCACVALKLDAPVLAALRETYGACLCVPCLRQLQPAAEPAPTVGSNGSAS